MKRKRNTKRALDRKLKKLRKQEKKISRDLRSTQRELLKDLNWAIMASTEQGREFVHEQLSRLDKVLDSEPIESCIGSLGILDEWRESGYPRFTMTDQLVASLAVTQVSKEEVVPPFSTFGIGFPMPFVPKRFPHREAIAWRGDSGWHIVVPLWTDATNTDAPILPVTCPAPKLHNHLLDNFCHYINAVPSSMKPMRGKSLGSSKKRRAPILPNRWIVDTPNKVKLKGSDEIIESLRAGVLPGKSFKIGKRFMVRGHWRNQACGPGRSQRRMKWIAPYLKGPEEGEAWSKIYEVS